MVIQKVPFAFKTSKDPSALARNEQYLEELDNFEIIYLEGLHNSQIMYLEG